MPIDELQLRADSPKKQSMQTKRCGFHNSNFLPLRLPKNLLFQVEEFGRVKKTC